MGELGGVPSGMENARWGAGVLCRASEIRCWASGRAEVRQHKCQQQGNDPPTVGKTTAWWGEHGQSGQGAGLGTYFAAVPSPNPVHNASVHAPSAIILRPRPPTVVERVPEGTHGLVVVVPQDEGVGGHGGGGPAVQRAPRGVCWSW